MQMIPDVPSVAGNIGLYVLADSTWGDPAKMVMICAEEGVTTVQLRCKGWPADAMRALVRVCRGRVPRLILNDDPALARELGLEVHLGQEDGPDPDGLRFGRSTHTLAQVAAPGSAAYLGFGPIFPTRTKVPRWPPRGLPMLREAVSQSRLPIVAIGGIDADNLDRVRETGVAGWAVAGAIWTSPDPRGTIRQLQR